MLYDPKNSVTIFVKAVITEFILDIEHILGKYLKHCHLIRIQMILFLIMSFWYKQSILDLVLEKFHAQLAIKLMNHPLYHLRKV